MSQRTKLYNSDPQAEPMQKNFKKQSLCSQVETIVLSLSLRPASGCEFMCLVLIFVLYYGDI